jgi:phosphoribosylformylglycinamidine synthase
MKPIIDKGDHQMGDLSVKRIFIEKKPGFDIEAQGLYQDLKYNLGIDNLKSLRIVNRYDVAGISEEEYKKARQVIFAELPVDQVFDEELVIDERWKVIASEFLPGQYDQRADSAGQCIQILTGHDRPAVKVAKLFLLEGHLNETDYNRIKEYCLNPLESQEASLSKPDTLEMELPYPPDVKVLTGFGGFSTDQLHSLHQQLSLAMSLADLEFCQNYFRDTEKRDPSLTEIRVLDTYWSDHCRHTTFLTHIDDVTIEDGFYNQPVREAYQNYLQTRVSINGNKEKPVCLMDLATIAMKELSRRGLLNDLDISDEINACSIVVEADINGENQEWLVMFKNETHNHPTEIEPFGGAATCLGGAIRDPLSGRSYVYQALRVTGSGDPRTKVSHTIPGKLPQRKITRGAAAGFSAYGNQIGLATGQVAEVYDEGFVAKRMEIGAVIGAVPRANVKREEPKPGDVIILLGGRTGRDGCGGATGSSKEHNEESLLTCGAEVQKGNPPTERKIQRLFRNPAVSLLIKRCNDFGAGGVAVAIGELADGLEINLDAVPKKYEGLDGTELAISESQERMAVVIDPENVVSFCRAAAIENLEATAVAVVTAPKRLKMFWRGRSIVDINRDFLNSNGAPQRSNAWVTTPSPEKNIFKTLAREMVEIVQTDGLGEAWSVNLGRLNICSQKGLVERFDSTIGAGTVLMPFGGRYQTTPAECMAAKLPVSGGDTTTGTLMSFGYNPEIGKWSPFHGAVYAIIEAVAKIVASGGDYRHIRLTLQEYFEKLGQNEKAWGKPFSALLGAYYTQLRLGIPAIGGKDSMSGTFKDLTVPPTLVAFAMTVTDVRSVISPEFKQEGSRVILVPLKRDSQDLPDFESLALNYDSIHRLIKTGKVLAAHSVRMGGVAEAITKMCFGNRMGFVFNGTIPEEKMFTPDYGSIILEIPAAEDHTKLLAGVPYQVLGFTQTSPEIVFDGIKIDLQGAFQSWSQPLETIFPTKAGDCMGQPQSYRYTAEKRIKSPYKVAKPRVFIPVFPGTNCEYDSEKAFIRSGAIVETLVFRNQTALDIEQTIEQMVKAIKNSQIIMLPGGFSAGDEPDGSGKFIATAFRNPYIKEAVMQLLKERDGLMLGICNGFQALIKLGLVPYGEICELQADAPTLTFNTIGRHVSTMVRTQIVSNLSPWFANVKVGDIHTIAVSHGEGRFVAGSEVLADMAKRGQIATQYVDLEDKATYDIQFNPNGSFDAIEGITSPDGRILGKMGHSERIGSQVAKNVPGNKDQLIFEAGVGYFN